MVTLVGFLCATSVFSVSLWLTSSGRQLTTKTQRPQRLHREAHSRFATWLEEMKLLGSVFLARFIVWRELRREQREKSRLKF